jgi:hypothetical protein
MDLEMLWMVKMLSKQSDPVSKRGKEDGKPSKYERC